MFQVSDKIVLGMAGVRFLSAAIEFSAAFLMLLFGRVETAFKINSLLAIVGPTVLLTVTSLGLIGLAGKSSPLGMVIIVCGIILIFVGINEL